MSSPSINVGLLQKLYGYEEALGGFLASLGIEFSPVALFGGVADPGLYNLPDLAPVTIEAATYSAGGTPVSDTYTGITLRTLLDVAGGVDVTDAKNDVLSKFVVATGADGYKAAFSLGEIDPKFGAQPVLVAYSDTAGQLGPQGNQQSGSDGLARMVVPGDHAGGRYVSDLVALNVGSLPEPPSTGPGGVSDQLTVSGQVADPQTFTAITLAALGPPTTETATFLAGAGSVTDTYTGVSLWTLLQDEGLVTDASIKNDVLRLGVVATGSDGYRALISLGEIDPAFGNRQDLVAYADTGGQLGPGGSAGAMRLIVPGDHAGGRYVSNLVDLRVVDLTAPMLS